MNEQSGPTEEEVQSISIPDELSMFETPEELSVAKRLLPVIAAKANAQAEANKAKELAKVIDQIKTDNRTALEAEITKLQKSMTPPSPEELQALLDQEYLEFNVKVGRGDQVKEFVLQELPMACESRLLKAVKKTIGERLKDLNRFDFSDGSTVIERVQRIIEVVPGAMETLAECCVTCLDPFGEQGITAEWVGLNISSTRILNILHAQITVSRYRDFFSLVGRLIPQM